MVQLTGRKSLITLLGGLRRTQAHTQLGVSADLVKVNMYTTYIVRQDVVIACGADTHAKRRENNVVVTARNSLDSIIQP